MLIQAENSIIQLVSYIPDSCHGVLLVSKKRTEIPHLHHWSHTVQSTIKWLEKDSNETLSAAGGSLEAGKVSQVPMITPECCKNAKMTYFTFCGPNDVISSDFFFFFSTRP